jgi:BirA family biotin operon repressor/biotin-[acetyl-CoA-carboxylase] ligase
VNFDLSLLLREHRAAPISLQDIASRLNKTPRAVTRDLQALAAAGFLTQASPHQGPTLSAVPQSLIADEIAHRLGTKRIGQQVRTVEDATSTNDLAWEAAAEADNAGLAVFAESQSAGRGRLGNQWDAPPHKAILMSVFALMPQAPHEAALLTLAAGVATARAIQSQLSLKVTIKWPNDVEIEGKKAAGILVEQRRRQGPLGAYVIGIGTNVNQVREDFPPSIRDRATSCRCRAGTEVDRTLLARVLLRELDHWCDLAGQANASTPLLAAVNGMSEMRGRKMIVRQDGRIFRGEVIDILETYGLAMRLTDGSLHVFDALRTSVIE